MQIKIHRGINQIGGCVTEIKSNKTRILIDVGSNLPNSTSKVKVNVAKISKKCDAVFITHYHLDHIGEYMQVRKEVPIYIGEQAKEIFTIYQKKMTEPKVAEVTQEHIDRLEAFKTFKQDETLEIGDIKITPIRIDHSAFDSYMFLIEAEGKRVLHTGDFRTHGPSGKDIPKIFKEIGKVDILICEHTTLSRLDEVFMSELKLQEEATNLIKNNKYVFIMCASTNIDRIASFYHANKEAGKKLFICDVYQKEILDYVTKTSKKYKDYYDFSDVKSFNKEFYQEMVDNGFCMLVRSNYFSKRFINSPNFKDNIFIYSQWLGYLKGATADESIVNFVPKEYYYLHTSGHATAEGITEVCNIVKPTEIIPIHGENSHDFDKLNLPYRVKHLKTKKTYNI